MKSELAYKDCLTNEMLHKSFRSQFDLVLHAIRIASGIVHADQDTGDLYMSNVASDVLSDIADGAKKLEPIVRKSVASPAEVTSEEMVTKTKKRKKKA